MPKKALATVASRRPSHSISLPAKMPDVPPPAPEDVFQPSPEVVSKEEKRVEEEAKMEPPIPKSVLDTAPMMRPTVVVPIEVDGETFQGFLQALTKVVIPSSQPPVLSAVKMTYGAGELELEATDLTLWAIARLKSFGGDESFQVMLPVARSLNVIKRLRQSYNLIRIGLDADHVHLGNYSFPPAGQVEDYPRRPLIHTEEVLCALPALYFEEILSRVAPAVGDDIARRALTGVNLDLSRKFAVATDGHRLHKLKLEQMYLDSKDHLRPAPNVTLSTSFFRYIAAVANRQWVGLKVNDKQVSAAGEDYAAIVKVIEESFPPWEQAIPKYSGYRVLDKEEFLEAIKDAMPLCGKDQGLIIQADGLTEKLLITATGVDGEKFSRTISSRHNGGPSILTFGANPRYLSEAATACRGGLLRLSFGDGKEAAVSAMRICGETDDFEAIVMPMKL